MHKAECKHKNKAYSPNGTCLTSMPPIIISYWICKDCGFEGSDSSSSKLDTEYEDTKRKFKGNASA